MFLDAAAPQPHDAAGEQVADLAQVRRQMEIDRLIRAHAETIRIGARLGSAEM